MAWLRKIIHRKEYNQDVADAKALNEYIQNIYWAEDLTVNQLKKNIEESVIGLLRNGNYASNGLLVTTNGYFLTARHCIKNIKELKIKNRKGDFYSLEKICEVNDAEDLALVKAKIDVEPEAIKYKFYNTNILDLRMPIVLMGYDNDGKFEKRGGLIVKRFNANFISMDKFENLYSHPNHFVCSIKGKPGC